MVHSGRNNGRATHKTPYPREEALIPLFGIIVPFATAFSIIDITFSTRHRERMNMIDKGMGPQLAKAIPDPLRAMHNGLMLLGLGLVAGWLFRQYAMDPASDTPLPYLAGPAIFAGRALVFFYLKFGRTTDVTRPE